MALWIIARVIYQCFSWWLFIFVVTGQNRIIFLILVRHETLYQNIAFYVYDIGNQKFLQQMLVLSVMY